MKKKSLSLVCLGLLLFGTVASLEAAIITDGLVASYSFNGNANDDSGYGNHGIVTNAILTADRFGNANSAYSFDGNSYITIPDSYSLDMTDAFTLSMWVKPTELPDSYFNLISKGDHSINSGAPWQLTIDDQGYLGVYRLKTDNYSAERDIAQLQLNEWTNIAITYSQANSTVSTFINGLLVADWGKSNSIFVDDIPITIGAQTWEGNIWSAGNFKGQIDDVNIFNRTLSGNEIQQLNAVPIPGAVWLLGSGVAGLIGIRRKKKYYQIGREN